MVAVTPTQAFIVLILLVVWIYTPPRRRLPFPPPVVRSYIPWIGSGLHYIYDPNGFLLKCKLRYGPVFKFIANGQHIVVLSSPETISSFFRHTNKVLDVQAAHFRMFRAISGFTDEIHYLHKFMDITLFPLVAEHMSKHRIKKLVPGFGADLLNRLDGILDKEAVMDLTELVDKTLYESISFSLFGPSYPLQSYYDFRDFDMAIPTLLIGIPFLSSSGIKSRNRLLSQLKKYIKDSWRKRDGDEGHYDGVSELVVRFNEEFRANDLSESNMAGLLLAFVWGAQSNTIHTCFWTMVYLLGDDEAMRRIRQEIDHTVVVQFGGLDILLKAESRELEGPKFALLDSAINESMRLTRLPSSTRTASSETEIRGVDGELFLIQKGDWVFENIRGVHMDPGIFSDADSFKIDRFIGGTGAVDVNDHGIHTNLFRPWGGGTHLCKGRHFAMYSIKLFLIVCLYKYDVNVVPVVGVTNRLPKTNIRSIAVFRANEKVKVRLRRREVPHQ